MTYPPDLEPSLEKVPPLVIWNSYDIPVVIYNRGRSDARNFNVTVSIDGVEVLNETIGEIKGVQDGGSIPLTITKKAPSIGSIIKFNVTVDVDQEDKVEELINNMHGNGEGNNIWNDTVTVFVNPPGPERGPGGGGGTGGGWGEGTGTGEGSGSGAGKGVAGGTGEGGAGESGGKTIRGRLMKGSAVSGKEAGGGGKGEFSLVRFLMQLVMLAAALSLVGAGYLLERRRHNSKQ